MMACVMMISRLLIPVLLSVSANTDGSDLVCIPSLMVPRNTGWSVHVAEALKINCTVVSESHCWRNLNVSWCRISDLNECRPLKHSNHIITRWSSITENKRMLFLIFWNISMQDAGLYRCIIKLPSPTISHAINVTVTDIHTDYNVNTESSTAGTPEGTVPVTDETNPSGEKWFSLIYFSVLVIALVLAAPFIMSRGLKKFPEDEVAMTTVIYEEAETPSVEH